MVWFKVDDSFYDHPKVFDLSDAAITLWVRAGCWAARNLTDGHVPAKMPARLCTSPEAAARELMDHGLWTQDGDGAYRFHDWEDYQPDKESVKRKQARGAARQARFRAKSKTKASDPVTEVPHRDGPVSDAVSNARSDGVTHPVSHAGSHAPGNGVSNGPVTVARPVPSRPDLNPPPTPSATGTRERRETATRPTDEDDDEELDRHVAYLIQDETGRPVSPAHARRERRRILEGRQVRDKLAYLTRAIRSEPHRYAPSNGEHYDRTLAEALARDDCDHGAPDATKCALCREGIPAD